MVGRGCPPAGDLDHRRGGVDPARGRAAGQRQRAEVATPAADVEHAHAGA
jgi:hypothetical protein